MNKASAPLSWTLTTGSPAIQIKQPTDYGTFIALVSLADDLDTTIDIPEEQPRTIGTASVKHICSGKRLCANSWVHVPLTELCKKVVHFLLDSFIPSGLLGRLCQQRVVAYCGRHVDAAGVMYEDRRGAGEYIVRMDVIDG
jgi:hypothetical protein